MFFMRSCKCILCCRCRIFFAFSTCYGVDTVTFVARSSVGDGALWSLALGFVGRSVEGVSQGGGSVGDADPKSFITCDSQR